MSHSDPREEIPRELSSVPNHSAMQYHLPGQYPTEQYVGMYNPSCGNQTSESTNEDKKNGKKKVTTAHEVSISKAGDAASSQFPGYPASAGNGLRPWEVIDGTPNRSVEKTCSNIGIGENIGASCPNLDSSLYHGLRPESRGLAGASISNIKRSAFNPYAIGTSDPEKSQPVQYVSPQDLRLNPFRSGPQDGHVHKGPTPLKVAAAAAASSSASSSSSQPSVNPYSDTIEAALSLSHWLDDVSSSSSGAQKQQERQIDDPLKQCTRRRQFEALRSPPHSLPPPHHQQTARRKNDVDGWRQMQEGSSRGGQQNSTTSSSSWTHQHLGQSTTNESQYPSQEKMMNRGILPPYCPKQRLHPNFIAPGPPPSSSSSFPSAGQMIGNTPQAEHWYQKIPTRKRRESPLQRKSNPHDRYEGSIQTSRPVWDTISEKLPESSPIGSSTPPPNKDEKILESPFDAQQIPEAPSKTTCTRRKKRVLMTSSTITASEISPFDRPQNWGVFSTRYSPPIGSPKIKTLQSFECGECGMSRTELCEHEVERLGWMHIKDGMEDDGDDGDYGIEIEVDEVQSEAEWDFV